VIAQIKWVYENCRFSTTISLYFENGKRYGHSCNARRMGTLGNLSNGAISNDRVWPLTHISRSRYYSTSTRKWYKIQLYLQWQTNIKSYIIYRSAPFSMTLNDRWTQWPWVTAITYFYFWASSNSKMVHDRATLTIAYR